MSFRSQIGACAVITLSLSLNFGCGEKRHDAPATTQPLAASHTPAAVTPNPQTTSPNPLTKKHFWFTYTFDNPGKRDWVRVADKKWEERAPNDVTIPYVEGAHYDNNGIKGLVVTREDGSLDVLIPDGGIGSMILFRDPEKKTPNAWSPLGAIEGFE